MKFEIIHLVFCISVMKNLMNNAQNYLCKYEIVIETYDQHAAFWYPLIIYNPFILFSKLYNKYEYIIKH